MEKECWVRHCNSFLKFQTISNRCFCYFYRLIWHALRKFNRLIPYSIGWSITFFKEIKMLFHSIGRKLSFSCSMREIQQKTNCFLKWKPKIEYNAVILNSSNVFMLPQLDRTKLWWKFFLIQFLLMFFLFCFVLCFIIAMFAVDGKTVQWKPFNTTFLLYYLIMNKVK